MATSSDVMAINARMQSIETTLAQIQADSIGTSTGLQTLRGEVQEAVLKLDKHTDEANSRLAKAMEDIDGKQKILETIVERAKTDIGAINNQVQALVSGADSAIKALESRAKITEDKEEKTEKKIQELWDNCNAMCNGHNNRLLSLENRATTLENKPTTGATEEGGKDSTPKSFVPIKDTKPGIMDDDAAKWRLWKEDFISYLDSQRSGLKILLVSIEDKKDKLVRDTWLDQQRAIENKAWIVTDTVAVYRALKHFTIGEARKIVESVDKEDGYQAWANLNENFKPALALRQGTTQSEVYK